MSLYHTTAEILKEGTGSLRSRIFGKSDLKSQPTQIYALAVETCKWSLVLKEVIEKADFLNSERKLTPILSILLVHDLLLAKQGIALPATHGLRIATERHKIRLQAEFTKARVRRKLSTLAAFKEYVEAGSADENSPVDPYPRWVRVNTLKTSLEDQLDTTLSGYERTASVKDVRQRGQKLYYIDEHIPNLIGLSPNTDILKCDAYKSGAIIFQDKASCFPAYLLDPLPGDGDFIDTCSAPGNKTTHLAAILISRNFESNNCPQIIHAFEKNKLRAETLKKMIKLAGSERWTELHPGQDFLSTDPNSPLFKNVGALLLDPSCSGSGIVGRDEEPVLHLPHLKQYLSTTNCKSKKKCAKIPVQSRKSKGQKREDIDDTKDLINDDSDGEQKAHDPKELTDRLTALANFQLELLLHAFKFPAAKKITYSTCSVHAQENELVLQRALEHDIARQLKWRILKRDEQPRGMKDWPFRGSQDAGIATDLAAACIRTNKGDEQGTMGFFVAALVRDVKPKAEVGSQFLRDQKGNLIRNVMGIPSKIDSTPLVDMDTYLSCSVQNKEMNNLEDEWNGIPDNDSTPEKQLELFPALQSSKKAKRKRPEYTSHIRKKIC